MNKPITPSEKQVMLERRRDLFSLWQSSEEDQSQPLPQPQSASKPAPRPTQARQPQARPAQAQRQSEEVQDLLRKFVNLNSDRWSLF